MRGVYRFLRIHCVFEWRLHNLHTNKNGLQRIISTRYTCGCFCKNTAYILNRRIPMREWENEQLSYITTKCTHTPKQVYIHTQILRTSFKNQQQQQHHVHHQCDPMHVLFSVQHTNKTTLHKSIRIEQPKNWYHARVFLTI